jgi:hypothetical protein
MQMPVSVKRRRTDYNGVELEMLACKLNGATFPLWNKKVTAIGKAGKTSKAQCPLCKDIFPASLLSSWPPR